MNKRVLFFSFLLLLCITMVICSNAQPTNPGGDPDELVRISKRYVRKDIALTDGMIYKYKVVPNNDTARYFIPGNDTYEATVTFKKVGGTVPPVLVTEKVDGEKATFSTAPAWSLHGTTTAPNWYGENNIRTIAYSNMVGSSVSYTFTGTKIELWGERKLTHGKGVVNLNGVDTPVTFVGVSALPVLIYSSPDLPIGTYTIKLSVVSGFCLLDFFQVSKPQ